jgi:predicted GIY-YIG superfamily endonuclease
MKPVVVCPLIYVLALEDDCYYVGITHNLNLRYAQHLAGDGANWTTVHKPLRIVEVISEDATLQKENQVTRSYINRYGEEKVRGGSYCRVSRPDPKFLLSDDDCKQMCEKARVTFHSSVMEKDASA